MNPFGKYLKSRASPVDERRNRGINSSASLKRKSKSIRNSASSDITPRDSPLQPISKDEGQNIFQRPQSPAEIVEPQAKRIALMMKRFRESPPRSRKARSRNRYSNSMSDDDYSSSIPVIDPNNVKRSTRRNGGSKRRSSRWKQTLDLENSDEEVEIENQQRSVYFSQVDDDGVDGYYEEATVDNSDGMYFMDEELEAERTLIEEAPKAQPEVLVHDDIEEDQGTTVEAVQRRLQSLFKKRGIEDVDLTFNPKKVRRRSQEEEEEVDDDDENDFEEVERPNMGASANEIPKKILKTLKVQETDSGSPHIPRYKQVTEDEAEEEGPSFELDVDLESPSTKDNDNENEKKNVENDIAPLYREIVEEHYITKHRNQNNKAKKSGKRSNGNDRGDKTKLFEKIDFFIQHSIESVLLEQEIKNFFKFKVENPRFTELKKHHSFGCVE